MGRKVKQAQNEPSEPFAVGSLTFGCAKRALLSGNHQLMAVVASRYAHLFLYIELWTRDTKENPRIRIGQGKRPAS